MLGEIQELLDEYAVWLKARTHSKEVNEAVEITTPYLDRHNDYIQLYVKPAGAGFLLTDGSGTISDLEASGCNLVTDKRQELLATALNGFGVRLNGKAIEVSATRENFALRKHSLVQAVLAVNDLFYLAEPLVKSLFFEDVVGWLDASDIRYTPKVKFTGKSGYDHVFDFVIPKSRTRPERIVRAINRPNRETAESFSFAWNDTREIRPKDGSSFALLNDTDHSVPQGVMEALRSYHILPVPWSERETVRAELAA